MINVFKKSRKPYFGVILGPFCPNLAKNEKRFSRKNGLCQFLRILNPKNSQVICP